MQMIFLRMKQSRLEVLNCNFMKFTKSLVKLLISIVFKALRMNVIESAHLGTVKKCLTFLFFSKCVSHTVSIATIVFSIKSHSGLLNKIIFDSYYQFNRTELSLPSIHLYEFANLSFFITVYSKQIGQIHFIN